MKFKIKSELNTIIIIDNKKCYYLEKNKDGYFEKEIIIQTKKGGEVSIGKLNKQKKCEIMVGYKVI